MSRGEEIRLVASSIVELCLAKGISWLVGYLVNQLVEILFHCNLVKGWYRINLKKFLGTPILPSLNFRRKFMARNTKPPPHCHPV